MRRRSGGHDPFDVEDGELNLTPYLDIITTLVIFMIFTFQVVIEFRIIDVFQPALTTENSGGGAGEQKNQASLLLTPSEIIVVAVAGDNSGIERVPSTGKNRYDFGKLRTILSQWKDSLKLEEQITLSAEQGVEYGAIVATMDAIRRDEKRWLFPDVVFGAAVAPGQGLDGLPGGSTP